MFRREIILLALLGYYPLLGQTPTTGNTPYLRILPGSPGSDRHRIELGSDIDATWEKWQQRGYHFGFDPAATPMYTVVDGILSTPYMIQVRGNDDERNRKRWGYHVFEGYARDDRSRITLLVNKHEELGKPVAEMYYYGTAYDHSPAAYNWVRIGSDVRQHSFLFGRDEAIFYGSLRLSNALTLGRIGRDQLRREAPEGDSEQHYAESAKHVNFRQLQDSEDGTLFYDTDHQMLVIRINGQWMKVSVEPLPADVQYGF
jgi:hypothetical protein